MKLLFKIVACIVFAITLLNDQTMIAYSPIIKSIQEISSVDWHVEANVIIQTFNQPVIVRGLTKEWPAGQWTPSFFAENYPEALVDLYSHWTDVNDRYVHSANLDEFKKDKTTVKLIDHCQSMSENPDYQGYVVDKAFFEKYPELKKAVRLPLAQEDESTRYFFFLGTRSTRTRLHTHDSNVFLAQLYGCKVVTLVSPRYREDCYARKSNNEEHTQYVSPVDILDPDLTKYPRFVNVELFQSKLNPGDVLFFPKDWFHDLRALEESITLSKFIDE